MMDSSSPSEQKQSQQQCTPDSSTIEQKEQEDQHQSHDTRTPLNELQQLLERKDREIEALKSELEKYKLLLHESQIGYRFDKQHTKRTPLEHTADDNIESPLESTTDKSIEKQGLADSSTSKSTQALIDDVTIDHATLENDRQRRKNLSADSEDVSDIIIDDSSVSKKSSNQSVSLINRHSITSSICSNVSGSKPKVIFKTGADEEEDDDDGDGDDDDDAHNGRNNNEADDFSQSMKEENIQDISENTVGGILPDDIQDVIQDVSEIDLELDINDSKHEQQREKQQVEKEKDNGGSDQERRGEIKNHTERITDEDHFIEQVGNGDEDILSEGLLTSLTDAAINNLSQLAALQERCESQQQSEQHQYQQPHRHPHTLAQSSRPSSTQQETDSSNLSARSRISSIILPTESTHSIHLGRGGVGQQHRQSSVDDSIDHSSKSVFTTRSSFSAQQLVDTNQTTPSIGATNTISAASAQNPSSIITHSQHTNSSSSSISPNSTIHADIGVNSGHSLASVVAAAAVAAAAAANHDQQQHHRPTHQLHSIPQSRLISSALPTSEFYHNLQQHSQAQQASFQAQLQHQHQQMSPVTPLSFSQSTSITPSPSSLIGLSRRSASNTSSLLSPITSPNYLRRQFMPDRMPMISPSSLTTGSSSGASSSLAHILQQHAQQHQQHHHQPLQQQRSVSAMAGTITSPTGTPLSGTGSSVVAISPLMSSKNSSQARLNNMQIRHKFGYLGSSRAQFNSPHGFCLGLNQEIVVADTNNHRVCIFDKSGAYITQFGSPGKEEGQLWNPRKVAILHRPVKSATGTSNSNNSKSTTTTTSYTNHFASEPLYVVCDRGAERSRMQLFTKDGSFIKKIGIHYIDIVAGLAITQDGLIIVVDSVSPTVYIINGETGSLNGWFDCSGHMKEPSDIAVKSEVPGNEYFICDFKGHCVVVFSEQGEYLRKIGHDGLTSYPNGIDISDDGDILVGDSHGNRFHVVVFDRNGNFVSQFECPHVKVSRCCGLKITREGYIVTLAKNNHHVLVLDTIHI